MNTHSLRRTNPKGEQPFIGECVYCGKTGLTMAAVHLPCPKAPDPVTQILDVMDDGRKYADAQR